MHKSNEEIADEDLKREPIKSTENQKVYFHPTETSLAIAFTKNVTGKMLYCTELGGWLKWTGSHWKRDKLKSAYNQCVRMARGLSIGGEKAAGRASFASGAEKIAQSEPDLIRTIEDFDKNLDLIATPRGTVDLRSGTLRAANPLDMITKCAGIGPEKGTPTEWLKFLSWAFDDDQDTIRYLQEYLGYSLTGHTGAEIFLYFDGPGGNGKSCIGSVLRLIAGDYFHAAPNDLFTFSQHSRHPTSIAALKGKRVVIASELPIGARLDEQRLKSLTGGDPIRARFMRQDEIEFIPEFKLMIAANHRPRIVRPDDAMRRRLRVIPMPHKPEKPDPHFKSVVLPAEASRIFNWMIEGAVRILEKKEIFNTPKRVTDASEEYIGSQDTIGQFIEERCNVGPELTCPRKEIYDNYKQWATEAGERFILTQSELYKELELKGYTPTRIARNDRGFKGIAVPIRGYY